MVKELISNLNSAELSLLVSELGSQSSVADLLNVNRSSVSRWLKKELPDRNNQLRITALVLVMQHLQMVFEPETSRNWLEGTNAHLSNQRPIELLSQGRISEVLSAIEQAELGSYT
ncbi:MAG: DUF2384 domain-containing protein [Candidatus Marinimicrobia bacterium]|nr:DUF2384 domain-containing protein [Candidatus Neomarinimicrobiota bacterium]MCH8069093.1 DUF2384 domain-containing protein [Candidatus Neomarinimicrobiota bacterium]